MSGLPMFRMRFVWLLIAAVALLCLQNGTAGASSAAPGLSLKPVLPHYLFSHPAGHGLEPVLSGSSLTEHSRHVGQAVTTGEHDFGRTVAGLSSHRQPVAVLDSGSGRDLSPVWKKSNNNHKDKKKALPSLKDAMGGSGLLLGRRLPSLPLDDLHLDLPGDYSKIPGTRSDNPRDGPLA